MRYNHIVFDMDGTLVNTASYTVPACRQASREMELPIPTDEAIQSAIGYSSPEFYRLLLPDQPEAVLESYGIRVHELEKERIADLAIQILFPGVPELLRWLRAEGVRLHIASTGHCEYVYYALTCSGIISLFDSIGCGLPQKESMAINIKNTSPQSSWVFIGDRFKDADAARAACMPSIFAGWSTWNAKEGALFDYSVMSIDELKIFLVKT